jgi:BNR repeat-like domain
VTLRNPLFCLEVAMSDVASRCAAHRGAFVLCAVAFGVLAASSGAHAQAQNRSALQAPDFTFKASGATPFAADCNGVAQAGTLYPNSEVEPFVAVNPRNPLNLVGVWQQDRWSNGGSQGLGTGYSFNGGVTWRRVFVPFSRCAGGKPSNNGDYERASDPWVSFSPNGVVHQMALSLNNTLAPGQPATALLASRSTDGGRTWSTPITLQADTEERFNDKNAITADPTDSRYVYGVWDRLSSLPGEGAGPTLLARSVDNGLSWEPARIIFDPGLTAQTIGNRIEVLPDGTLINLFTLIDYVSGELSAQVIRSTDKGATWSAPIKIADELAVGTADPDTGAPVRDGAIIPQLAIGPRGRIVVVWQDARFSGGAYDGIALSQSSDGGLTWSAPVQVNRDPTTPAFTPSVHVRFDGTVGVTYYDFRSNTADPATLPTDYWLARSRDGLTWRESRVSRAFDLAKAPVARGFFLGDYQGLVSIGPLFLPFYVKTTEGADTSNRNDVFLNFALGVASAAAQGAPSVSRQVEQEEAALPAYSVQGLEQALPVVPAQWRAATMQNAERVMRQRVPAWAAGIQQRLQAPPQR